MSDSSDLDALKDWVNQLEAKLSWSKRDLAHTADETQVYKEQLVQSQAQCAGLQVEIRCLTRRLNEQTAHPASPAAASQSEVTLLRQQLTEKDQVIVALEEKYQALLNSISLHAAKLKDATETLTALQNQLAPGGPPSEGDADSPHKNPGLTTAFHKQTRLSDNGSKNLVAQGATKTLAERPASQSKSPRPIQEPESCVEAPTAYSKVVTSRRAEEPLRPRLGQAPVPISHEISAKQEKLRAEKREEIQKSVVRFQKSNKVGGFQPHQNAERRADTTITPAPKQNIAASSDRGQYAPAEFILREADHPSQPLSKESPPRLFRQNVAATTVQGQSSPAEFILKRDLPSSSAPKQNVAATTFQERLQQAKINIGKQQESSSIPKQNVAATTGQGQSSSAESKNLKADLPPLPTPKPNLTASSNRPQRAEFILKRDLPSSSAPKQNLTATTTGDPLRQAELNITKDRPSSSAPRQNVASEFRLREDLPPSPVPKEKAVPVQAPSLKEPLKYSFDTREAEPSLKAPATYEVPSFLGFLPNFQVSTPQKPVITEPTAQQPTKDVMDWSRNPVNWANEMEENESDEDQRRFGAYGSSRAKAEGHGLNDLRGRGQADRQGRGRGGRGGGVKAPPSHSDPANYLLNQPWRPGSAVREAQSTPHSHPMYKETWRKTDSSDGTRKITNVIRSETRMRSEEGVPLAKEET